MTTNTAELPGELLTQFSKSGREKRTEVCWVPEKHHPSSPWRNARRMSMTYVAFEAHLPQSTAAGTAHLTAPWPTLKEEIQGMWMPAWSPQTQCLCGPDQKGKKSFQVWGTATELLKLEESKRTVDLNWRSYAFLLPFLQRDSFGDCSKYFTLYRYLKCFTIRFYSSLRAQGFYFPLSPHYNHFDRLK